MSRSFAIVGWCGAGFIWLLLLGAGSLVPSGDRAFFGVFGLCLGAVFPLVMFWVYRLKQERWRAQAPQRLAASPPPGTQIRLDSVGLAIGDSFVAWRDLTVDRVDLASIPGRYGAAFFLRRVLVRGPGLAFALDIGLIRNGQPIVDEVYRRLCRPALSKP